MFNAIKSFYVIFVLILSLLLLAGCAAAAAGDDAKSSGEAVNATGTVTSAPVSSDTAADQTSSAPSTTVSADVTSSASGGRALQTVSEEGYNVWRLGYLKLYDNDGTNPLESYDGEVKLFTESEYKKTYPDTYASPYNFDTRWITFTTGPTILKIGETYRIPIGIMKCTEVMDKHIHVANWKISDTSVLKMIDWDSQKGCNVEALKPGKVKVTMTVKMDTGSYKKSTTVYVLAEDEPLPVIKRKIWTAPTEEERRAMEPSSEPAVSTDESQESFSSRGSSSETKTYFSLNIPVENAVKLKFCRIGGNRPEIVDTTEDKEIITTIINKLNEHDFSFSSLSNSEIRSNNGSTFTIRIYYSDGSCRVFYDQAGWYQYTDYGEQWLECKWRLDMEHFIADTMGVQLWR